jgi:hypothetical protein
MRLLLQHHPLLARGLAALATVMLLCAQVVLLTHAHAEAHGHGGEESEPACSVCLFQAAGHGVLGLPSEGAESLPRPAHRGPAAAAPPAFVVVQGWRTSRPARGPPVVSRTS